MSTPYYADADVTLWHGKSEQVLTTLADGSVDAVVCDPPYELGFMGRAWDASGIAYSVDLWREVLRVLKPGGHLLAFGGTRTVHRVTCAIEDAGFEIRDGIDWIYGQGFPKSLNVSRAVDQHRAARGSDRVDAVRGWLNQRRLEAGLSLTQVNEALGAASNGGGLASSWMTNPTSRALPSWEQWTHLQSLLRFGTDMDDEVRHLHHVAAGSDRPVVGRRTTGRGVGGGAVPIITEGSTDLTAAATEDAAAWEGWGTALKPAHEPIVVARRPFAGTVAANVQAYGTGAFNIDACRTEGRERTDYGLSNATRSQGSVFGTPSASADFDSSKGRWPSNVVLSHAATRSGEDLCGIDCAPGCPVGQLGDNGRYFPTFRYEAKAPTNERPSVNGVAHTTVKPLDLMRWLVRLVTPTGGLVLDPFAGSGTTAEACVIEGFRCIAVEQDAKYLPLITARLSKPLQTTLFGMEAA